MLAILIPCLLRGTVTSGGNEQEKEAFTQCREGCSPRQQLTDTRIRASTWKTVEWQRGYIGLWPDNSLQSKSKIHPFRLLRWSRLDVQQGNSNNSLIFIFIGLGLGSYWKLDFSSKNKKDGQAYTWWCSQPNECENGLQNEATAAACRLFSLKYCWGFISSSFSGCVSWLAAAVIYFIACMLSSFLTLKPEEARL